MSRKKNAAEGAPGQNPSPPGERGQENHKLNRVLRNSSEARAGLLGPDSPFFQKFLNTLDVGVASVTAEGRIEYANPRFGEAMGIDQSAQLEGSWLKHIVTAGSWEALETALREATKKPIEGEMKVETENGRPRVIRLTMSPVANHGGPSISVVATEVTELLAKNEALQEKEASLQSLSARILQLQDEERRRIARDLHDITGQELAAISLSLGQVSRSEEEHPERKQMVADAIGMVRKVEDEIRTLSYLLHPPLLDELGLGSALNWYVEGFQKRSGIEVKVEVPGKVPRLTAEKETALFRVVQEALTNILRHSGSQRAWITVTEKNNGLLISVRDEGKGMAVPTKAAAGRTKLGVGILGMRERLRQLGGGMEIESGNWGTTVMAFVPMRKGEREEAQGPAEAMKAPRGVRREAEALHEGTPKRILIADDHEVTREGIKTLLKEEPDMEICGEAQDGLEAIDKTRQLRPDLLVLDLSMPGAGGLTVARRVRQIEPDTKILVFTTHSYPGLEKMVKGAGCQGYVQKANASQELVKAARTVLNGAEFYSSPGTERQAAVGSI